MDLSYSTTNLFPVPIHIFDVNGFNQIKNQLIDYAYDLKKKDSEGVTISNRGGWQSSGFNIDDKDDILQSFLMNCLDGFPNIKKSVNFKIYAQNQGVSLSTLNKLINKSNFLPDVIKYDRLPTNCKLFFKKLFETFLPTYIKAGSDYFSGFIFKICKIVVSLWCAKS